MNRFTSHKRDCSLLKVILIGIALIIIDLQKYAAVQATECFPLAKSKLPKVNRYKEDLNLDGFTESFDAVVGTDDFIIYGGRNYGEEISTLNDDDPKSFLARMDLSTNNRRWAKTIELKDNRGRSIWALALNPSNEKIAIHAYEKKNDKDVDFGRQKSFFWIMSTQNGSYVNMPIKMHTQELDYSTTSSSAMYFSQHDKLIMAFERGKDDTGQDKRMRVIQFDFATRSMDWHRLQNDFYGRAAALAVYDDATESNSHIYLGGGASHLNNEAQWAPAIFHLDSNGDLVQEERLLLKENSNSAYTTDDDNFAKIDHMKLDMSSTTKKIFGTTRGSDFALKGSHIYVFTVTLLADFSYDAVETFQELTMPSDSYVTGIGNDIADSKYIHLAYFVPSTSSLYYMRFDNTQTASQAAVLLYDQSSVENFYIRETVFAGTRTGTYGGASTNFVKQAYSVGSSTMLTNADDVTAQQQDSSSTMGIVLPSLREETCLKIVESTVNIDSNDFSSQATIVANSGFSVLESMIDVCSSGCDKQIHDAPEEFEFQTSGTTLNIGDIITQNIEDDDWCTDYDYGDNEIVIEPGKISTSSNVCGISFDDVEKLVDIVLPSISSPACSDDGANLWSGYLVWSDYLEDDPSFNQEEVRINLNLDQSKISIRGISDYNQMSNSPVSFTANFALPNGATSSFSFSLSDGSSDCVITQPSAIDGVVFTYLLGSLEQNDGFLASSYTMTGACGSITYTNTIISSPDTYDDDMVNAKSTGIGFEWSGTSSQISNVGTYTLNVVAQESCTEHSSTYTLEVMSCANLNAVSGNYSGVLTNSYTIGDAQTVTWDAFTTNPSACATTSEVQLVYQTYLFADGAIQGEDLPVLFNFDENSDTSGSLDLGLLTDRTKGGTIASPLNYRVFIMLQDANNNLFNDESSRIRFFVQVIDPCRDDTINLGSVVPTVGDPSLACNIANDCFTPSFLTFDYSTATHTTPTGICPGIVYTLEMQDGSAYDASTFDFDSETGDLTIQNTVQNDFSKINTYSMKLTAKFDDTIYSEAGSQSFEFQIYCNNENNFMLTDAPLPQIDFTLTQEDISTTFSEFTSQCPVTYTHQVSPADPITTTLVVFDANIREFTFSGSQITENLRVSPYFQEFLVNIYASTTNVQTATESFTLKVHNPCIDSSINQISVSNVSNTSYEYTVGQSAIIFDLPDYSSSIGPICGSIKKSVSGVIDDFITYDANLDSIQVVTQNSDYGDQSYTLAIDSYLEDYPQVKGETFTIELSVKLTNRNQLDVEESKVEEAFLPQFQFVVKNLSPSTSQSNIELSSQVKLDYSRGQITDDTLVFTAQLSDKEGDPFIVTFGDVETFLRPVFKDDYITITVDQKTARNGSFTIPITVTQTVEAQQKSELYSLEMIIEGITQPAAIEKDEKIEQTDPIAFEISKITETGLVTIKFDDEIDPVALKEINIESLRVEIIAIDQTYVSQLLFVWEAVKITSTELEIQLKFERETYVSQALTEKDTLQVEILKSNLLISETTGKQVRISSKSAKSIPVQISQEEESVIAKMRQVATLLEGGTSAMIGSNLAMQLILGGSLAVMWGLINSIQIIANFPLIVVKFPPNALIFYKILYSLANFSVLPEEYLQEWTSENIGFQDDEEEKDTEAMEKISYQLQENGAFENPSFWENNFMAIAIFCCLAVSSVFLFLLQLCFTKFKKARRLIDQMKQNLLWNSFLRFGLEQALVGSITSLIQIYEASSFDNKKAGTETSIAYLNLTVIVLLAVITPIFLHRRKEQLREIQHQARFGALMLDMDVNRFSPKLFQTFFILRRVLLSVLIVFLKDLPWVQIIVTSLLSLIQLMYLLVSKPFIEPSMNRLEIYHEINVLFNTYALFIFSQSLVLKPNPGYPQPYNSHIDWEQDSAIFISDFDAHYDIAWAIIALLTQFIAVNLSLLIMGFIRTIYWKIKRCCLKNTQEKKLEEQQKRIQLRNQQAQDQKPETASNNQVIQPADDNQLIQPADDNQLIQPAKNPLVVSSTLNNSNSNNNQNDYQQQFTQLIEARFKKPKTIQQNNDSIDDMIPESPKLIPSISNNQQNDEMLDIISEVSEKESERSSVLPLSSKLQISSQSSHNDTSGLQLTDQLEKQIAEMKLMVGDKSARDLTNPQLDINFPDQQDASNSTRIAQAYEQYKNIEDEADEILADQK